ncbi:MAG: sugar ABC transporter permease [Microbacteriaceae bacterium]
MALNTLDHAVADASRRRVRRRSQARSLTLFGLGMVAPAVVLYAAFVIYPLLRGAWISLFRWDGLSAVMTWVGVDNYVWAFQDQAFWAAVQHTFVYAIATTIVKNLLGFVLALLLSRNGRIMGFLRTAAFLPVTMSFVVIGILFSWIFNPTFGLADGLFQLLGIPDLAPGWLSDPNVALWSVIFVDIWKWTGFHMVLYLGALAAIPAEINEAAALDGASGLRRVRHITIPLIIPTLAFSTLIALTGAFVSNYDLVYVMTGGGPMGSTEVALTYITKQSLGTSKVGYANAMSMILFVGVAVLGALQLWFMRRSRR